jgi:hypothetical protein
MPKQFRLDIDRRITGQNNIRLCPLDQFLEVVGILALGYKSPVSRILSELRGQLNATNVKASRIGLRTRKSTFWTRQPHRVHVRNRVTALGESTTELRLKWMTSEIVDQKTHSEEFPLPYIVCGCARTLNRLLLVCATSK